MTGILSTRKPLFWFIAVSFSVAGIWFAIKNYSVAFPIAQVDIKFSRKEAIEEAKKICEKFHLGPQEKHRHAASFETDSATQLYVELEAGGSTAFNQIVTGTLFSPYTWQVRHFVENDPHEVTVLLKPDGAHYGFIEKVSENMPGPALPVEEAKELAEAATKQWLVGEAYHLVESSKEQRPNGRVDHTFTYELPEKIGEGRYRYQIVVSGDKVTTVKPSVKVPESFFKHYSALRSGNLTIRQIAVVLVLLLYLIIGCYGGLFFLLRRREVIWKQPIFWAFIIAGVCALDELNGLPLAWMKYDTATSVNNFLFIQFTSIVSSFIQTFLVTLLVAIIVAEGFTRLAFGDKVQLWRVWSKNVAASPTILGQTIGGYLLTGTEVGFSMVLFYIIARNYFGWWVPSQTLADPNVLARYVPWLHPIAASLHAGFWEECLFRAVPLGGAALLGERFGKRNLFIAIGMVVQILIFGAGHAHYPAEPAIARVIELIIPSFIFGVLYLLYGLLPIIIAHYTYDAALIGLPIFISHAHGGMIDKVMVVIVSLIPLWIILYRLIQQGGWRTVPSNAYNKAYVPSEHEAKQAHIPLSTHSALLDRLGAKKVIASTTICFIGAVAAWGFLTRFNHDETRLHLDREKAIAIAQQELAKHNVDIQQWHALSNVSGEPKQQDRYIWQEFCRPLYRELMHDFYLQPPCWEIRFATWQGKLADRAEEYHVNIARDGTVVRYEHKLPQHKPGLSLTEHEARDVAHKALSADGFDVATLNEMGAVAEKQPERTDWKLTFELKPEALSMPSCKSTPPDNKPTNPRLRIDVKISGDKVTEIKRYVYVPEQWSRADKDNKQLRKGIKHLITLFGYVLIGLAALYAFITFQWTGKVLLLTVLGLLALGLFSVVNIYDMLAFKLETSQSIAAQLFRMFSLLTVLTMFLVGMQALVAAWLYKMTHLKEKIRLSALSLSIALGATCAALLSWMDRISSCCAPAWAHYQTAGLVFPLLGTAVSVIDLFISILIKLLAWGLMCNAIWYYVGGHKRTVWANTAIILLTMLTAHIIAEPALEHDIHGWVIGSIGFSIILIVGYYLLYRFDLRLLIPTATTYVIISQLKQLILHAFPGAWLGAAAGLVMVALLAWGCVYLLRKRE